jgi:hypothetical protein
MSAACTQRWRPSQLPTDWHVHGDGPGAPCRPRAMVWAPRSDYVSPAAMGDLCRDALFAGYAPTASPGPFRPRRMVDLSSSSPSQAVSLPRYDIAPTPERAHIGGGVPPDLNITAGPLSGCLLTLTPKPAGSESQAVGRIPLSPCDGAAGSGPAGKEDAASLSGSAASSPSAARQPRRAPPKRGPPAFPPRLRLPQWRTRHAAHKRGPSTCRAASPCGAMSAARSVGCVQSVCLSASRLVQCVICSGAGLPP